MTDITKHKFTDNDIEKVDLTNKENLWIKITDDVNELMFEKSDAIAIAKHFGLNKDLIEFAKGIMDKSINHLSPELVGNINKLIEMSDD